MQRLLAIVWLTWKAAFRFRLFWVLSGLLLASVVLMPLLLQDDGTARGFTQILLTYTLAVITALLGFATLWLSCGTLARDIEDCQMQMVAVKPIARWQIWLGKWLGIVTLDAVLLALSGACVAGLLQWRAQRLPEAQQKILRSEVLVARASLREAAPDIESDTDRVLQQRLKDLQGTPVNVGKVREEVRKQVKAMNEVVPPNMMRRWKIDLGVKRYFLKDERLFLRVKFFAAQTNATGTYLGLWEVGPPDTQRRFPLVQSLAANTFHEFAIPPGLFDDKGQLTIDFQNRNNVALLFPLEEGLEVLYREGGFALNFARGLGIVLCWLALLASMGLAAASCLSFPVAAFLSGGMLIVGFSSGTLASAVETGSVAGMNEETGEVGRSGLDVVLIPMFKGILKILTLVQDFSPIDALSTGRSITWGELGLAFVQIVLVLGGIIALAGIILFTRRELATAQGNS